VWGFLNLPFAVELSALIGERNQCARKLIPKFSSGKAKVSRILQRLFAASNAEIFPTAASVKLLAAKLQCLALKS
jgi:hypothetical protein